MPQFYKNEKNYNYEKNCFMSYVFFAQNPVKYQYDSNKGLMEIYTMVTYFRNKLNIINIHSFM